MENGEGLEKFDPSLKKIIIFKYTQYSHIKLLDLTVHRANLFIYIIYYYNLDN